MRNKNVYDMLRFIGFSTVDINSVIDEVQDIRFIKSIGEYFARTWYVTQGQERVVFRIVNEFLSHNLYREVKNEFLPSR